VGTLDHPEHVNHVVAPQQTRLRDMRKRSSAQMRAGSCPVVDEQRHDERIFACLPYERSFVRSLARSFTREEYIVRYRCVERRGFTRIRGWAATRHRFFGHAVFSWTLRWHVAYRREIR